jgi:hypothetical protein
MRLLLALVVLLNMANAIAVSLEFKFDVNSSGPSIYPCNAGIKHASYSNRVCYDRVTNQSCNPAEDCLNTPECNCVCTGSTSGQGETRLDYLSVSSAEWTDNGEVVGATSARNLYAPETSFKGIWVVAKATRRSWLLCKPKEPAGNVAHNIMTT